MNSKSTSQAMETEKIPRLLAQLAIPAVVAQIINLLYNIVDRIYIGHISGVGADSSETSKANKDVFMEAPDGEIPFA